MYNERPVYVALASLIAAMENCRKTGNTEWHNRHEDHLYQIVRDHLPSGSGWDTGTKIHPENSNPDKIVLTGSYHHMNEGGYYDGWTDHQIIVRPSLQFGMRLTITGRDRNSTKEYLHDLFDTALRQLVYQDPAEPHNYRLYRPSVIRSISERGYWSNAQGWVFDVASATKFVERKADQMLTFVDDATWVYADVAVDFAEDAVNG